MKEHYHNTNKEEGEVLEASNKKAKSQEREILVIFQEFPKEEFTPEQLWKDYFDMEVPLTSVRRAFSNLSDPKIWNSIEKTGDMVKGLYGKNIHTWKLK